MKLTVLTCTADRPQAFELCKKYMARQTVKPFQWIILDDGDGAVTPAPGSEYYYLPHLHGNVSMLAKVKLAITSGIIKGDALVFWEDDDFYAPTWLEWCAKQLEQYNLVGEGRAIYYNVAYRNWTTHDNRGHASLCSTAIRTTMMATLLRVCNQLSNQFIDDPLWKAIDGETKKVFDPNQTGLRQVVGMKGLPGRIGIGGGHSGKDQFWHEDYNLYHLQKLIGEDAKNYAPFFNGSMGSATQALGFPTWLAALKGKPGLAVLEIGALRGNYTEWLLDNIFTGGGGLNYACLESKRDMELEAIKLAHLALRKNVAILEGCVQERVTSGDLGPLDMVIVNATGDAKNLLRIATAAFDLLKRGCRIIFCGYDNTTPEDDGLSPSDAINQFLERHQGKYFMFAKGPQVVLLKQ
jgi:hypothetical protein